VEVREEVEVREVEVQEVVQEEVLEAQAGVGWAVQGRVVRVGLAAVVQGVVVLVILAEVVGLVAWVDPARSCRQTTTASPARMHAGPGAFPTRP
jgi:hypothetical protein